MKIPWEELFGESSLIEGNESEGFVRENEETVLDFTHSVCKFPLTEEGSVRDGANV